MPVTDPISPPCWKFRRSSTTIENATGDHQASLCLQTGVMTPLSSGEGPPYTREPITPTTSLPLAWATSGQHQRPLTPVRQETPYGHSLSTLPSSMQLEEDAAMVDGSSPVARMMLNFQVMGRTLIFSIFCLVFWFKQTWAGPVPISLDRIYTSWLRCKIRSLEAF